MLVAYALTIGDAARAMMVAVVLCLLAAGAGLAALHIQGARLLSVQTASMRPAIRPGDAVFVRSVSPAHLSTGSIISYTSPRDPSLIISHRLIAVDHRTGWLITKGDNLHTPDPAFPPSLVIGRVSAVAPGLGRLLNLFRRPLSLAIMFYLPAVAAITVEIRRLAHIYARPFYSARLEA